MLPPLPDWDAAHPLIVHFPIGLLLVAPVFMLIAVFVRKPAWTIATVLLLLIGTVGTWGAYYSGEAAEVYWRTTGDLDPDIDKLMADHHVAGGQARLFATFVTIAFIAWALLSAKLAKKRGLLIGLGLVILVGFLGANLRLVQASHMGGRLVHEFRITAPYASP
ncbi:MAG: DUF2231 domain-containing protein [Phycisphaerales bacterium]